MKKPLVIYHKNCPDGFAAAWCFYTFFGDTMEYHAASYGSEIPDITERTVYLVDFCYKQIELEAIILLAEHVVVLDHHQTSLEFLKDIEHSNLNTKYCTTSHSGAMIAWDYLTGKHKHIPVTMPDLLKHIEDRDLWKFELAGTKEIMAAVHSYPYNFESYEKLMKKPIGVLYQEGLAIRRAYEKNLEDVVRSATRRVEISIGNTAYHVPMINCSYHYASEACHKVCENEPFAMSYYDTIHYRVFSLRSREDGVDVAKIAEIFGGGGHKHASGFKVSREHWLAKY